MKKLTLICFLSFLTQFSFSQGWVLANGPANQVVNSVISYNGDTLLAGVDGAGIFISYDNGINWTPYALSSQSILSLVKIDDVLLAGTDGNGIYRNINLGNTWSNVPINNLRIYSFTNHNDSLYFSCSGTMGPGAVYLSLDTGQTWSQYLSGPPFAFLQIAFNHNNNRLLTASPFGAHYKNNLTSLIATTGVNGTIRTVAHLNGDTIIYGIDFGTYISYNNGASGQLMNSSNGSGSIFPIEDTLYRASANGSLMYNSNISSPWQVMPINNSSVSMSSNVLSVIKNNGRFITGTFTGIYYYSSSLTVGVDKIDDLRQTVSLYPNPNRGSFTLNMNSSELNITVSLLNSQGKVTSKIQRGSDQDMTFDFDIPSGLYFLKIEAVDRPLKLVKFIVQ